MHNGSRYNILFTISTERYHYKRTQFFFFFYRIHIYTIYRRIRRQTHRICVYLYLSWHVLFRLLVLMLHQYACFSGVFSVSFLFLCKYIFVTGIKLVCSVTRGYFVYVRPIVMFFFFLLLLVCYTLLACTRIHVHKHM